MRQSVRSASDRDHRVDPELFEEIEDWLEEHGFSAGETIEIQDQPCAVRIYDADELGRRFISPVDPGRPASHWVVVVPKRPIP